MREVYEVNYINEKGKKHKMFLDYQNSVNIDQEIKKLFAGCIIKQVKKKRSV